MLPCICSVTDHIRRQNVVRTSVTHSAIASCATYLLITISEIIISEIDLWHILNWRKASLLIPKICRAGETKIVFFGGVWFLSSMRLEVSGSLQIETVFHVMLQYWTLRHFSARCYTNESKETLSCCLFWFLCFKFSGENFDISSIQRFCSKLVGVL